MPIAEVEERLELPLSLFPMWTSISSLRFRLIAIIALSGMIGLGAAVSILVEDFKEKEAQVVPRVTSQAESLSRSLQGAIVMRNRDLAKSLLEEFNGSDWILEAHLFNSAGTNIARFYADDPRRQAVDSPDMADLTLRSEDWIVVPIPDEVIGDSTLAVRFRSPSLAGSLRDKAPILTIIFLGTSLSLLLLNRLIKDKLISPILGLSEAARVISEEQDYSIRAIRKSDGEVGDLVDTFNGMLTQIELRDLELQHEMKRAESAIRAKAQFLATMSHELRTPMNGVIGMSELLSETELSPDQRMFAETIQSSATGLLAIINDILDFSKIESGNLELEEVEFDLRRIVEESISTLAHTAQERGLLLLSRISTDVPCNLRGDPSRLRQTLLNLLSNALKFTQEGDVELRISLVRDEFHSFVLLFEVEDTGIGIPPGRMERLFKPFSQVDVSDTRKYGGTGLGLAISKEVVSAMGGEMHVTSDVGLGSTFSFTARFGRTHTNDLGLLPKPPRTVRCLVAHPHPKQSESIAHLLGPHHEVETVQCIDSCRAAMRRKQNPVELAFVSLDFLADADRPAHGLFENDLFRVGLTIVVMTPVQQLSAAAQLRSASIKGFVALPAQYAEFEAWVQAVVHGRDAVPTSRALKAAPEESLSVASNDQNATAGIEEFKFPDDAVVLVAEDNPVNQRVVTRILQNLGLRSILCKNGNEAVRQWRTHHPSVVLMDLQMPEKGGLEASREIRALEKDTDLHTPIVALTANVGREVRQRCQDAGMDGHLSKPFQVKDLREMLAWCFGNHPDLERPREDLAA